MNAVPDRAASGSPPADRPDGVSAGGGSADGAFDDVRRVRDALRRASIGHEALIERLLVALLCAGHVLLEGPPGVAKTRTVKRFAASLGTRFARVQATPDLLPADLTGTDVHRGGGEFAFRAGPLFHHVVLVDEVNRAPPKVQSALLEAMGERQITTGGVTRALEEPFLVAATQNPLEHEGTYPLPEAQLDRFMFRVDLALPDVEGERRILDLVLAEGDGTGVGTGGGDGVGTDPGPVVDVARILQARHEAAAVHLSGAVRDYAVRLVGATRGLGAGGRAAADVVQPASPRASIALATGARARAWLDGRDHAVPDDVAALAPDVLSHRIALDYRARAEGASARERVRAIVDATPRT